MVKTFQLIVGNASVESPMFVLLSCDAFQLCYREVGLADARPHDSPRIPPQPYFSLPSPSMRVQARVSWDKSNRGRSAPAVAKLHEGYSSCVLLSTLLICHACVIVGKSLVDELGQVRPGCSILRSASRVGWREHLDVVRFAGLALLRSIYAVNERNLKHKVRHSGNLPHLGGGGALAGAGIVLSHREIC